MQRNTVVLKSCYKTSVINIPPSELSEFICETFYSNSQTSFSCFHLIQLQIKHCTVVKKAIY